MPYGYSDNGSRRIATRAQAGLRTYFQPQGKPYTFKLVEVPIPLEAYGYTNSLGTSDAAATVQPESITPTTTTTPTTDTTKTSVDLAQYAPLAEAAGALLGTVASTLITKGYETKQLRIEAEAAAAAAPQTVVQQYYTKTGEGISGTTLALIAGAVVVVGGIVYFASQGGDEEEVEEEGVE